MDSHIAAVATRLNERVAEIGTAICAALEEGIAELPSDDPMIQLLQGAVRDHIRLGPLASDTDDDARLRNTLQKFLRFGSGYKAAAEELNTDPSTVKSGVERAVARRGRAIDDRADVELALLACRWYGAAVLRPD